MKKENIKKLVWTVLIISLLVSLFYIFIQTHQPTQIYEKEYEGDLFGYLLSAGYGSCELEFQEIYYCGSTSDCEETCAMFNMVESNSNYGDNEKYYCKCSRV